MYLIVHARTGIQQEEKTGWEKKKDYTAKEKEKKKKKLFGFIFLGKSVWHLENEAGSCGAS